MRKNVRTMLPFVVVSAIALGCLVMVATSDASAVGKPVPPTACCNPADEPGVGGNPLCFEGHTCCSDGVWRCNQPDGSPSCDPGEVCDGECGGWGDPCSADEDCCSGICKQPPGRCR